MNPEINETAVAEKMNTAPVEVVIPTEEVVITEEILAMNPGLEEHVEVGDVVTLPTEEEMAAEQDPETTEEVTVHENVCTSCEG